MYVQMYVFICVNVWNILINTRTLFQRGAVKRVAGTKPLLHARHTNRYIHTYTRSFIVALQIIEPYSFRTWHTFIHTYIPHSWWSWDSRHLWRLPTRRKPNANPTQDNSQKELHACMYVCMYGSMRAYLAEAVYSEFFTSIRIMQCHYRHHLHTYI